MSNEKGQPIIFINYRRTDSGWPAISLARTLKGTFGEKRVFQDVRDIGAGDEFALVLEENLRRATVVVVLIGKDWLFVHDKHGRRRIDRDDDWVRREIRMALQRPGCTVIPVLVDDAEPLEREALPEDIAEMLSRQHIQLRQDRSDDDIDALSRVLEKLGFERVASSEPADDQEFNDEHVRDVVVRLRSLQRRKGAQGLNRDELLPELDQLFNRKTFRFESLRKCPEQRWADRLDSAYQTEKVLSDWRRNVREVAENKYQTYIGVMKEVGSYCMQMGTLLFQQPIDYNSIEGHIGKPTFKTKLPPSIQFPVTSTRQPIIPDEINDVIERHRKRAISMMNKLVKN